MPRTKQNSRLLHQVPVVFPDFFRSIECGGAVGHNIDFRWRVFVLSGTTFKYSPAMTGAIHQHGQRNGRKMNVAARLIRNMQRRAKLPSRGQPQARAVHKLIGTEPGGIQQQRVPVYDVQLFRGGQPGAVAGSNEAGEA